MLLLPSIHPWPLQAHTWAIIVSRSVTNSIIWLFLRQGNCNSSDLLFWSWKSWSEFWCWQPWGLRDKVCFLHWHQTVEHSTCKFSFRRLCLWIIVVKNSRQHDRSSCFSIMKNSCGHLWCQASSICRTHNYQLLLVGSRCAFPQVGHLLFLACTTGRFGSIDVSGWNLDTGDERSVWARRQPARFQIMPHRPTSLGWRLPSPAGAYPTRGEDRSNSSIR